MGIEQHIEPLIDDPFAAGIRTIDAFAVEIDSQRFGKASPHCSSALSFPSGVNQPMSVTFAP